MRSATSLRAIVFDVDGTLYRQDLLRRTMLFHLVLSHVTHPARGWRTARILQAYRRAQEDLRATSIADNIADAQITRTCERTHFDRATVVECVARWIEREPLAFLPRCVQPGLLTFLQACRERGLLLATLSDYPAEAKLEALGITRFFDVVLSAQDPGIDSFKPNPRGLLIGLSRLGVVPSESLYVGDRLDVDAPTAEAAGTHCAVLSRRRMRKGSGATFCVTDYAELQTLLFE